MSIGWKFQVSVELVDVLLWIEVDASFADEIVDVCADKEVLR